VPLPALVDDVRDGCLTPLVPKLDEADAAPPRVKAGNDCETHSRVATLATQPASTSYPRRQPFYTTSWLPSAPNWPWSLTGWLGNGQPSPTRNWRQRSTRPNWRHKRLKAGSPSCPNNVARRGNYRRRGRGNWRTPPKPPHICARHDEIARTLHEIGVELTLFAARGRKGKLDAAETKREQLLAVSTTGLVAGARAVQFAAGGDGAPTVTPPGYVYVEPFRAELQRYSDVQFFGPEFRGRSRYRPVYPQTALSKPVAPCRMNHCRGGGPRATRHPWPGWPVPRWSPKRTPSRF